MSRRCESSLKSCSYSYDQARGIHRSFFQSHTIQLFPITSIFTLNWYLKNPIETEWDKDSSLYNPSVASSRSSFELKLRLLETSFSHLFTKDWHRKRVELHSFPSLFLLFLFIISSFFNIFYGCYKGIVQWLRFLKLLGEIQRSL